MHYTRIKHGVERHLRHVVCIEDCGVQRVIQQNVQRQMPYVVCVENGGSGA